MLLYQFLNSLPLLIHVGRLVDLLVEDSKVELGLLDAHLQLHSLVLNEANERPEELLGMATDVTDLSCLYVILDLLPVLAVGLQGLQEELVLIRCPRARL